MEVLIDHFLYPDFPPADTCPPILSVAAHRHRLDTVEGLGKNSVLEDSFGKSRNLHLNTLQKDPTQRKIRQVQAA